MFRWTLVLIGLIVVVGCEPPRKKANSGSGAASTAQGSSDSFHNEPKQVGAIALKPTKLLNGDFEVLLPADFTLMDEEMLRVKYPNENRPTLVYTNPAGSVNIAVNHTANRASPAQIRQLHAQLDTSIRQAQPQAQWMFSGVWNHAGREWAQLEFNTQAVDTKIHNMMLATSADNRVLMLTFNTTDELSAEWLPVGREIINSVFYRK
jgi:hypothetical protein